MGKIEYLKKEYSDEEIYEILEEPVKEWFRKKYKTFTPPQRYAIKEIHEGKNVLICSPTGSGKTLSAFLAGINELIKLSLEKKLEDRIYILYISPLRALNNDIERNLKEPLKEIYGVAKEIGVELDEIRVAVRTSDTTTSQKQRMLKKPPHILITTPESLAIALNSPKFSQLLSGIKYVIVDEIHALTNKRGVHLSLSLERLNRVANFIRIGLSATIYPLTEVAKFLVGNGRDCYIVDVSYKKEVEIKVISPVDDFIYTPSEEISKNLYGLLKKLIEEHKTTLIFTNTRSATERVAFYLKQLGVEKVETHHSSLSREHRLEVEEKLKKGELKCVISSTSLELGVDIGSIDLVILLGSPKSVSRALQRIGRSGHRLHEKSKGIIIPFDRDDLVENVVLAYDAKIGKIDRVYIPKNCLDVLSQHLVGMALEKVWDVDEAYNLIKKAYPYKNLSREDFLDVLNYLSGGIEEKNVYAKIWLKDNKFGKRGKSVRAIYYMNVGTIPDETAVDVIADGKYVGEVEEEFAEKLMKGDIFVLGGKTYKYLGGRGNKIRVKEVFDEKPTIPAWFSEQLPLAYDLALDIEKFRKEVLSSDIEDIKEKYDIDEKTAKAIKNYMDEQDKFAIVPDDENALIESFEEEKRRYYIFHFVAGRRANEALARAFANYISKIKKCNVRLSVNDYGFALILPKNRKIKRNDIIELFNLDIVKNVEESIERSEILKRRFRHVATRGFMILRRYMKRKISVDRQQFNAEMLLKYCKEVNHPLYRETLREILEDSLDIDNALDYFEKVKKRKIYYLELPTPSPFAFNLVVSASSDIVFMEDKKRMIAELHKKVMEFISRKRQEKD
ncbi:DEAD/H associated domain protein [Methanocaldococcus vulcanius M7]|uniref:DEAD/H associated domain protein n=1 Tax=Methanocaldococcus vulcanius (strain ATCC 700851 / DSM 12094 / M7) TaxID=579137 RepID=C9RH66_METVM|nr:ATP-dependent helicase [Methanocaldococcus vulcanius]ACX72918.1 DEAD/H associated domain protein [Methanocaldococcus vulcanius M7]